MCWWDTRWGFHLYVFFKKKIGGHESFLWGHWYPCFGLLVTSPLGFKARVGSLIRTWWRHTCYMFPEIHIYSDTCWPLGSQHGSRAVSSTYLWGIGSFLRFRLIKTPPSQYLTFPKCVAIKESVLQILGWIFSKNISLQKRNCRLRLNVELIGLLWMRTESVLEWCLWQENKISIGGFGGGGHLHLSPFSFILIQYSGKN